MSAADKADRFCNDFNKLSKEGKQYILAIQQALIFAQKAYSAQEKEQAALISTK